MSPPYDRFPLARFYEPSRLMEDRSAQVRRNCLIHHARLAYLHTGAKRCGSDVTVASCHCVRVEEQLSGSYLTPRSRREPIPLSQYGRMDQRLIESDCAVS